jgi:glycine dehydrogenase subunit 1
MLEKLGMKNVDELFAEIPENVRLNRPLKIPDALSEIELENHVNESLSKNKVSPDL